MKKPRPCAGAFFVLPKFVFPKVAATGQAQHIGHQGVATARFRMSTVSGRAYPKSIVFPLSNRFGNFVQLINFGHHT
jgi:hypothetical protein